MNISVSSIFSSVVFGGIGLWFFMDGKRRANNYLVVIGIILMIYTYFTSGFLGDWGIGIGLCLLGRHFLECVGSFHV